MAAVSIALALLGGVIGAGFASGREILRFFAAHGRMAPAAIACALMMLVYLFSRLPAQMERFGCASLSSLCRARFGPRMAALACALFALLCAATAGAMLSACAELGALLVNIRHAYGLTLLASLLLSMALCSRGLHGAAAAGGALLALLPVLLIRMLLLPRGEACFLPAMTPDLPVRAAALGAAYGALNAALLAGSLPLLLPLGARIRRRALLLFASLFGALLILAACVIRRHMPAVYHQPLPIVYLSRSLGPGGYLLVALSMYAAALSTLVCMLLALSPLLPVRPKAGRILAALTALAFALFGFESLVARAYPMLGALCAGLLLLLCAGPSPASQYQSPSSR